ncbi:MAG: transcription antitermination factor NusB [Rickettsiales bacterium]|nr:transcription antitermination factor NusB [Rickettsiales bacterium]
MSSQPNPSLQRKTAARITAVQGLYRNSVGKEALSAAKLVSSLKSQLENNRDEQKLLVGAPIEPHYGLLEAILNGVYGNHDEINLRINSVLNQGWTRERTGALLIAILECAVFELFFYKEISGKIVIDEYTRITRRFFSDAEVDFIYSALNTLQTQYG